MPAVRLIEAPERLQGTGWINAVRIRYAAGDSYDLHVHDFAEVFWIESGTAIHVLSDGQRELPPGSLVCIRPHDAHGFATLPGSGFTMINFTIRSELIAAVAARAGETVQTWPWREHGESWASNLGGRKAIRLQEWADDLILDGSRIAAEAFLFDLLRLTVGGGDQALVGHLPEWLRVSLVSLDDPAILAGGMSAFVATTGRSVGQVNRAVRLYLGMTTTQLVNDRRLLWAERRLRATNDPIVLIADECGFASLSHFYRAFTARFAVTPKVLRLRAHALPTTTSPEIHR